jgi:hypothetical protein
MEDEIINKLITSRREFIENCIFGKKESTFEKIDSIYNKSISTGHCGKEMKNLFSLLSSK